MDEVVFKVYMDSSCKRIIDKTDLDAVVSRIHEAIDKIANRSYDVTDKLKKFLEKYRETVSKEINMLLEQYQQFPPFNIVVEVNKTMYIPLISYHTFGRGADVEVVARKVVEAVVRLPPNYIVLRTSNNKEYEVRLVINDDRLTYTIRDIILLTFNHETIAEILRKATEELKRIGDKVDNAIRVLYN